MVLSHYNSIIVSNSQQSPVTCLSFTAFSTFHPCSQFRLHYSLKFVNVYTTYYRVHVYTCTCVHLYL